MDKPNTVLGDALDRGVVQEFLYIDPDNGDASVYLMEGDVCRLATVADMAVDMCSVPIEANFREKARSQQ